MHRAWRKAGTESKRGWGCALCVELRGHIASLVGRRCRAQWGTPAIVIWGYVRVHMGNMAPAELDYGSPLGLGSPCAKACFTWSFSVQLDQ